MNMLRVMALAIAAIPCMAQAISYDEARNAFKEILYERQAGLMKKEAYFTFIESHLQEAEKTLKLAQHYKNHPNAKSIGSYFSLLADSNVASFHYYIAPNKHTERRLAESKSDFCHLATMVKRTDKLNDINANAEADATFKLLKEANERYYKELSLKKKLALWVARFTL